MDFVALLVLNVGMVSVLVAFSRSWAFGYLAGSAVNPLLVFCLISVLFNTDFVVVWFNPELRFIERAPLLSPEIVVEAYWRYTFIFAGAAFGMIAAIMRSMALVAGPIITPTAKREPSAMLAANILFCGVLLFCTAALVLTLYHQTDDNLSYQMVAHQNPLSAIAAWIIPGSLALFMASQERPFSLWPFTLFVCVFLLVVSTGGVRVIPLVCLLVGAITLAGYKRLPALWCVPAIPAAAVFLAYSRYVFREQGNYPSFSDFVSANGGFVNLFFLSEELSFAKMFTAVYELSPALPVQPFVSILAFFLAPLPRSLFPLKPYGPSAYFTQHASPERWEWTKSESLVTGYADLYWQFGVVGAFTAMAVIAFFWMSSCLLAIRASRQWTITWIPILIWWMYIFVRGDIFNVSLLLWPAVAVVMLHQFLTRLLSVFTVDRAHTTMQPP